MGWIRTLGFFSILGSLAGCDTDGPNRTGEVELREVSFADGSVVPACFETNASQDLPGYIDFAALSSPDLGVFEAMGDSWEEQTRIKMEKLDGEIYRSFAADASGDFKTASVRSQLARCEFEIPDDAQQSALSVNAYGAPVSLSYQLFHRDGRVEYIEVRRRESQS